MVDKATHDKATSSAVDNSGGTVFGADYAFGGRVALKNSSGQGKGGGVGKSKSAVYDNNDESMVGDGNVKVGNMANNPKAYGTNYAVGQAYTGAASGTTAWGHPHWGQGVVTTTQTWSADTEKTAKGTGHFAWPNGSGVGWNYDDLSP